MARIVTDSVIAKYKKLIAKKAWQYWVLLPVQTRVWIDLEDMIQDGILYTRFHLLEKYDPSKASFITVLYLGLENHFKRKMDYLMGSLKNTRVGKFGKRYDGQNFPLEDVEKFWPVGGGEFVNEPHATAAFRQVYFEASPNLRMFLQRWFLQQTKTKLQFKGKAFKKAKAEFILLSGLYALRVSDCRYLLRNETWRKKVVPTLPENEWTVLTKTETVQYRKGRDWQGH